MHAWRIKVRAKQKAPWTSRLLQQIELRAANDDEQGRNCDGGYAATLIGYICFALPVQVQLGTKTDGI